MFFRVLVSWLLHAALCLRPPLLPTFPASTSPFGSLTYNFLRNTYRCTYSYLHTSSPRVCFGLYRRSWQNLNCNSWVRDRLLMRGQVLCKVALNLRLKTFSRRLMYTYNDLSIHTGRKPCMCSLILTNPEGYPSHSPTHTKLVTGTCT